MDISSIHDGNSPRSVASDVMDVSMSIDKAVEMDCDQTQSASEPSIDDTADVSMDCDGGNGTDISVDMGIESTILDAEHNTPTSEPPDSHSIEPITPSSVDVPISSEMEAESADPCLSFERSLFVSKSRTPVSPSEWTGQEARAHSQAFSPEFLLADPLKEFNQIRPAQVSFGGLDSDSRPQPRPIFTPVLTPMLSSSMGTVSMHALPSDEFLIAGKGKFNLQIARDRRLVEPLLPNFEFLRATSTHAFDQLKAKPPVILRQRVTVEEFIYDLLELNVSTAIKTSSFEVILEKILPIESWKAGKLQRSEKTDFWSEFLVEFNELPVDAKIQRINSLKDFFYDRICSTAVKRAVSSLLPPLENLEHRLGEKVAALEKEVQAKLKEVEQLEIGVLASANYCFLPFQILRRSFWIVNDPFHYFAALTKAREKIEETKAETVEILKEREEFRLQLESMEYSKVVEEHQEASFHRHLPTSYYVGLGASLFPFGPSVPQSRLLAVCRSLFSTSQITCASVEDNVYHINTLLGLILIEVHCKSRQQWNTWSASEQEILSFHICLQKDLAQLDAVNDVAEFAVDRLKQRWSLLTDCLVGRTLEDFVDVSTEQRGLNKKLDGSMLTVLVQFLEYSLQSYVLLMMFLRALFFVNISALLELPPTDSECFSQFPDQDYPTKAWRYCPSFYTVAKALSFDAALDSKPLRLIGIIAPKEVNAVLKTVSKVSSISDLLNAESISSISLEDPIGNIRLELLQQLSSKAAPHAPDNFVSFHERLVTDLPRTLMVEDDESGE
ncbi:unnamed protein product [Hydatigera taeniaeformis]|uniref:Spc7 domain-containing protein n=1 Tax=Hydatigena taeniaeformis TaxID=6205 RepID=A0A0R3X2S6_HYDTA|nr:unnamed protein product [Hydatigera taeniaeformis]